MKYAKWITTTASGPGMSTFRAELRGGKNGRGRSYGEVLYTTRNRQSINEAHQAMKETEARAEKRGARIVGKAYPISGDDYMANSEIARMGYFDSTAATGLARLLPSPYLYIGAVEI